MNVNTWIGCGRLTNDAETSVTKAGTTMSKFRIAVNDRRDEDKPLFINILCFGKLAETLQPKLVKGRLAHIQGKLKVENYEKDNQQKTSVCIMANEIELGIDPSLIQKKEPTGEQTPF